MTTSFLFDEKSQNSYDLLMEKLPIILSGTVVEGKKYGQKIGFPTANLNTDSDGLANGIYAGFVTLKKHPKKYPSAIVIDPTSSLEIHIFDFNENIYGQILEVQLLKFVRPFEKFETEKELIVQIKKDLEKIKEILFL